MKIWIVAAASVAVCTGGAHAADLGTFEPVPTAPFATYSWTGLYAGLQGGYSWAEASQTYDDPITIPFLIDPMAPRGWGGGLEAGVNYQFANRLVVGLEADVTFADVTDTIYDNFGSAQTLSDETVTSKTDLAGNIRARFGYAFDRTLIFAAGGLAMAHVTVTSTASGGGEDDATVWGWTVGGGIEQAITDKVSVKAEYLYTQHGDHTWFASEPFASTGDDSVSTVRVGLNLHF